MEIPISSIDRSSSLESSGCLWHWCIRAWCVLSAKCPEQSIRWRTSEPTQVWRRQVSNGRAIPTRGISTQSIQRIISGLKMATDTVTNVTKMVWLATISFQAVGKLATSSKLTTYSKWCRTYQIATKTCELVTKFLVLSHHNPPDFIFNFEPCLC